MTQIPDGRVKCAVTKHFFFIVSIFLLLSYLAFGTYRNMPYKVEGDGKYYYQYLVSILYDGDVDFTNNYQAKKYDWMLTDVDHYNFRYEINAVTGRPANPFSVGPALLWTPFFVTAVLVGKALNLWFYVDLSPYGKFLQYATMVSGIFYTVVGLYILYRLLVVHFGESCSKLSLWTMLVMTPLCYYTVFEPSMSHVYDFFSYSLLIYVFVWCYHQKSNISFLALGCASALHILVRTQNVVTVAILAGLIFFHLLRSERAGSLIKKVLLGSITVIIGISPLLLINDYIYGHPLSIPQGNGFLHWTDPQITNLLFSNRNGLFSQHPIFFLAFAGFVLFFLKRQNLRNPLFLCLFTVFCAQVYINSAVDDWWSGHSFGQRRLLSSLPLFAFGLCYLIDKFHSTYRRVPTGYVSAVVSILTLSFLYLTLIHVFIWNYNQPHNILAWMFYHAPKNIHDYVVAHGSLPNIIPLL